LNDASFSVRSDRFCSESFFSMSMRRAHAGHPRPQSVDAERPSEVVSTGGFRLESPDWARAGNKQDPDFLLRAFKADADRGDVAGQMNYGWALRLGPKNLIQSTQYFQLAANQDYAPAQVAYGYCLLRGEGVTTDDAQAAALFSAAADHGDSTGQLNYGLCLSRGRGVSLDIGAAVRCFRSSADQGNPWGQYQYGRCLELGLGVPANMRQAVALYKAAHLAGVEEAHNSYGLCLEFGRGVPADHAKAAEVYANCKDFPAGLNNYARCLQLGRGVEVDLALAAQKFKQAAGLGLPEAQNNFAVCLQDGIGVTAQLAMAVKYLEKAAQSGLPEALNNLGLVWLHGPKLDLVEARKNFRLAAEKGHAGAQNSYALCLELGLGGTQDITQAARYFEMAAVQGNVDAQRHRCRLMLLFCNIFDPSSLSVASPGVPLSPVSERLAGESIPGHRIKLVTDAVLDLAECESLFNLTGGFEPVVGLMADRRTRTPLVVKEFGDRDKDQLLFRRQLEIGLALGEHPCIVSLLGFLLPTPETSAKLAFEYMQHDTLSFHLQLVKDGEFSVITDPTNRVMAIVAIVLGMRYVHRNGFIHRNLTPTNLLFDGHGRLHIGEFGCGKFMDGTATASRQIGTPLYMAPELYEEEPYTNKIDVFSFSLVLYEILEGRPVWDPSLSLPVLMHRVLTPSRRPQFQATPEQVRNLISRGWGTDAAERPTFEDILAVLQKLEFRLCPQVDASRIHEFIEGVTQWENQKPNDKF
jgi:TPR repeat protein